MVNSTGENGYQSRHEDFTLDHVHVCRIDRSCEHADSHGPVFQRRQRQLLHPEDKRPVTSVPQLTQRSPDSTTYTVYAAIHQYFKCFQSFFGGENGKMENGKIWQTWPRSGPTLCCFLDLNSSIFSNVISKETPPTTKKQPFVSDAGQCQS